MIHLDTSVLIDALTGRRRSAALLHRAIDAGNRLEISAIVLFEWLQGPRDRKELAVQELLLPAERVAPFDIVSARKAAMLYRSVRSPRGREFDLAIAACAIAHDAPLWTLNTSDFTDIPGLILYEPPAL